jgi:hypothetical protein
MAKVYRVVDHKGKGMYRPGENRPSLWALAVGNNVDNIYSHPSPWNDRNMTENWPAYAQRHGLKGAHDYWYMDQLKTHAFAFDSVHQLRRWIYGVGWLEAMHELGGVAQVYEVPDEYILVGLCQVTFDTRYAERLPDVSLIALEA